MVSRLYYIEERSPQLQWRWLSCKTAQHIKRANDTFFVRSETLLVFQESMGIIAQFPFLPSTVELLVKLRTICMHGCVCVDVLGEFESGWLVCKASERRNIFLYLVNIIHLTSCDNWRLFRMKVLAIPRDDDVEKKNNSNH